MQKMVDGVLTDMSAEEAAEAAARAPTLADAKANVCNAITARRDQILAAGAPAAGGLHVAIDDRSRADLGGMATTAGLVLAGVVPAWPEEYARGWIPMENSPRIPLATPAEGAIFALVAGRYYASVVQHARDLKDSVLAAADPAALDAIDIAAGWPG